MAESLLDRIVDYARGQGVEPAARGRRWALYCGDAAQVLAAFPAGSIHTSVTSPPYWQQRDYGHPEQIGAEHSLDDYIGRLLAVVDQVQRVLTPTGSFWLNLGDVYSRGHRAPRANPKGAYGAPEGSLMGLPARMQIAMTERGWVIRNVVVWYKPNSAPEPATRNRLHCVWEPILWAARTHNCYTDIWALTPSYELVEGGDLFANEPHRLVQVFGGRRGDVWSIPPGRRPEGHYATFPEELPRRCIALTCPAQVCPRCGHARSRIVRPADSYRQVLGESWHDHRLDSIEGNRPGSRRKVNRAAYIGDGWTACACDAGWEGGVVLDPFAGMATALVVALAMGRQAVGIDIVPRYVEAAAKRLEQVEEACSAQATLEVVTDEPWS